MMSLTDRENHMELYQPFDSDCDIILLESSAYSSQMLKAFHTMQKEEKYCDVHLVTPVKIFPLHRIIVMATAPSLLKIQQPSMNNKYIVYVMNVIPSVIEAVIHFMYTGELKVKKSEASLMKTFCETLELRSALELLMNYSEQPRAASDSRKEDEWISDSVNASIIEGKDKSAKEEKLSDKSNVLKKGNVTESSMVSNPMPARLTQSLVEKKETNSYLKTLIFFKAKSNDQNVNIQKRMHINFKRVNTSSLSCKDKRQELEHKNFKGSASNNSEKKGEVNKRSKDSNSSSGESEKVRKKSIESNSDNGEETEKIHKMTEYSNSSSGEGEKVCKKLMESNSDNGKETEKIHRMTEDSNSSSGESEKVCEKSIFGKETGKIHRMTKESNSAKEGRKRFRKRKHKRKKAPKLFDPECDHNYAIPGGKKHLIFVDNPAVNGRDGEETRHICTVCNKGFQVERTLRLHMIRMHEIDEDKDKFQVLRCNLCSYKVFRTQKLLAQHMINDHGVTDAKYRKIARKVTCRTCQYVFSTYRGRLRHEYVKHGVQYSHGLKVAFRCSVCGKVLSSSKRLKLHQMKYHGLKRKVMTCPCTFENCTFFGRDSHALEMHVRSVHSNDRPYSCEVCGKGFKFLNEVEKHVKNVHKNTCRICNKEMESHAALKTHLLVEHTREERQPFLCHICSVSFPYLRNLQMHLSSVHNQPLPEGVKCKWYKCDKCGLKTLTKQNLDSHLKVHEGGTEVTCSVCQRAFNSQRYLKTHMIRVHNEKGVISCSTCGKSFSSKISLGFHKNKYHRDSVFTCSVCQKKFPSQRSLTSHCNIMHKEDRVFTCLVCEKEFSSKRNLRIHMKSLHNEEEACICQTCGKLFKKLSYLKRHERIHHKKTSTDEESPEVETMENMQPKKRKKKSEKDPNKPSKGRGRPKKRKIQSKDEIETIHAETREESVTGASQSAEPNSSNSPQMDSHPYQLREKRPYKYIKEYELNSDESGNESLFESDVQSPNSDSFSEDNTESRKRKSNIDSSIRNRSRKAVGKEPVEDNEVGQKSNNEIFEDNEHVAVISQSCEQSPNKLLKFQTNQSEEKEVISGLLNLNTFDFLAEPIFNFSDLSDIDDNKK